MGAMIHFMATIAYLAMNPTDGKPSRYLARYLTLSKAALWSSNRRLKLSDVGRFARLSIHSIAHLPEREHHTARPRGILGPSRTNRFGEVQ
jgi:hypothetical protein